MVLIMSDNLQNCELDHLAFTIKPSETEDFDYFDFGLFLVKKIFGLVSVQKTGRGVFGFAERCDIDGVGFFAYGGNCGAIYFQITGEGCGRVACWNELADLLDSCDARIKRIDIAHDDYHGETLSIDWARQQYHSGGFKPSRGISPKSRMISDEGSGDGCTYYVGSRESGKMARIYEKGKQLGDNLSSWVRFEVEWRATHRDLPVQMLRDPSAYFIGAYPCCAFAGSRLETVRTRAFSAAASVEKALDHACKQAGGVIAALKDLGHTVEEIISKIASPTVSKRLVSNVIALKAARSESKPANAPAWWRPPSSEERSRTESALALDFSYWRNVWKKFQPENRDREELKRNSREAVFAWAHSHQA